MKILGFLFVVMLSIALRANPIATRSSSLVMTAENVLVKASPAGISVVGTYRFHLTPDRLPEDKADRFSIEAWMRLPIPVPKDEKITEELMAELNPKLIFHGIAMKPEANYDKFTSLPLVDGVEFMAVKFFLGRISVKEIEVIIEYTQPVIHRDGKLWAYYLPLIEGFDLYQEPLGLKTSSYAVSFEAYEGSSIVLTDKRAKILQSSPKLISVEPHNREILEVEIIPDQLGKTPTPSSSSSPSR